MARTGLLTRTALSAGGMRNVDERFVSATPSKVGGPLVSVGFGM